MFPANKKQGCVPADLKHNTTYYATVIAENRGLNAKFVNATSDGGNYFITTGYKATRPIVHALRPAKASFDILILNCVS